MAKNETYEQFEEKFKPKKTTDDCYTPPHIYDTVLQFAMNEYQLQGKSVVRPFFPGGDYENFHYPDGCVVIDNPPFSLFSKIIDFYQSRSIAFFLFAPHLTLFSASGPRKGVCALVVDASITYENGAQVNTSFVTNLDPYKFRTLPELRFRLDEVQKNQSSEPLKYDFPPGVVSAARLGKLVRAGIDFRAKPEECHFVRSLDHQKKMKKAIYGGGFLLSERKAGEQKKAEERELQFQYSQKKLIHFPLSDREQEIMRKLSKH